MSSSDKEQAGEKSGKKKQKRSRKADQAQSPIPDQQQAARELIDVTVAAAAASPAVAVTAPTEPVPPQAPPVAEDIPAELPPQGATKVDTTAPVGLQTIASAYRDYTRKSLEDARCYVEKLSGVRTFDKAMEVQTEFAKQAYETFAADSRRIRDLYGEYFKQTLKLPISPFDRPRDR